MNENMTNSIWKWNFVYTKVFPYHGPYFEQIHTIIEKWTLTKKNESQTRKLKRLQMNYEWFTFIRESLCNRQNIIFALFVCKQTKNTSARSLSVVPTYTKADSINDVYET